VSEVSQPASELLVEDRGQGVILLRLNRPKHKNALNLPLRQALASTFEQLAHNDQARCVVITGSESAFCAGADLREYVDATPMDVIRRNLPALWAPITYCPHPVIAAVCGPALGGGCELALRADVIVAGTGARFGQPEVLIGLMPGAGATQFLTHALGKFAAMKMLLTGDSIGAEEAAVRGLVSQVVPDAEVLDTALSMAGRIAQLPPLAVRQIKEVSLHSLHPGLESGQRLEHKAFQLLFASEDKTEGIRAFLQRRAPQFRGN
jgi:enoyl-CoA hydratase